MNYKLGRVRWEGFVSNAHVSLDPTEGRETNFLILKSLASLLLIQTCIDQGFLKILFLFRHQP